MVTLDECERLVEKIRARSTSDEFASHLEELLLHYKIFEIILGPSVLWRARKAQAEPYSRASDLHYPPAHLVGIGRLNEERSPKLYLATQPRTAILEARVQEHEHVQLTGYHLRRQHSLRAACVGTMYRLQKEGRTGFLDGAADSETRTIVDRHLLRRGPNYREVQLFIDAFLATILEDPNASMEDYRRCRALARAMLSDPRTEGVLYPSKADDTGVCVALNPGSADASLEMIACVHARVVRVREFGFIEVENLRVARGISKSGGIKWWRDLGFSGRQHVDHLSSSYSPASDFLYFR